MKSWIKTMVLVLAGMMFLSPAARAESVDDYTLMTEEYPPFNFQDGAALKGISVDLMDAMLKKIGSKLTGKDIQLMPWAQGYKQVQEREKTCLFATTRSAARENLFKWVGPIAPARIAVLAKKDKGIKIASASDLAKYKIGVVREDIGDQLIVKAGVPDGQIDRTAKPDANAKKLDMGRVDLWAYDETVAKWVIKSSGLKPEDFETIFVLEEAQLFYAFNKNTPDAVIKIFQGALNDLNASGAYQGVLDRYLK